MKQLPIVVLNGCSYVWTSLYRLCVPNVFGGRVGFDMTQVTSFLRVCWQLSPWWGVGLEMEGLKLEPGVRQDFPSAQWPSPPYQGWGLIPSWLCFLEVCVFHSPSTRTLAPQQRSAETREAQAASLLVSATDRGPRFLQCAACAGAHNCFPGYAQRKTWAALGASPC